VYSVVKKASIVGSTGTVQNNGTLKIKNGGLKDKIVEGHQFAKQEENILVAQMKIEDIATMVVWYEDIQ
jgi:hypothetical protein